MKKYLAALKSCINKINPNLVYDEELLIYLAKDYYEDRTPANDAVEFIIMGLERESIKV